MLKTRFTFAAKETNGGKLLRLDALYAEYQAYLRICLDLLIQNKQCSLAPSALRTYFPTCTTLSSQITKNVQFQAIDLIHTWVRGLYGRKLSKLISKDQTLTDQQRMELRCCGKYNVQKAGKFGKGTISQEMVDLYWGWVWDPEVAGNPPTISDRVPMMMTEMTCVFGEAKNTSQFGWWLRFSGLQSGKRIQVPLASTPYLKEGLAKTVMVSKGTKGRWRFQFSETLPDPVLKGDKGKVGLDVGLNCLAATSDGRVFGRSFKPLFDKTYGKVRSLRANRQRQGLPKDSPRLSQLERKLSGQVKTATGTVANKLVKAFPDHTFVVEDLDLRGCKGQKRFAYRALQHNLSGKAVCEAVNPAYTSQMCPSCGYVARNNRKSISFSCKVCGRTSHADVVGAVNLLERSGDKQISCKTSTFAVKSILRARYCARRKATTDSASGCRPKLNHPSGRVGLRASAPAPSGRGLTVKVSERSEICTAPKSMSEIIQTPDKRQGSA